MVETLGRTRFRSLDRQVERWPTHRPDRRPDRAPDQPLHGPPRTVLRGCSAGPQARHRYPRVIGADLGSSRKSTLNAPDPKPQWTRGTRRSIGALNLGPHRPVATRRNRPALSLKGPEWRRQNTASPRRSRRPTGPSKPSIREGSEGLQASPVRPWKSLDDRSCRGSQVRASRAVEAVDGQL